MDRWVDEERIGKEREGGVGVSSARFYTTFPGTSALGMTTGNSDRRRIVIRVRW